MPPQKFPLPGKGLGQGGSKLWKQVSEGSVHGPGARTGKTHQLPRPPEICITPRWRSGHKEARDCRGVIEIKPLYCLESRTHYKK